MKDPPEVVALFEKIRKLLPHGVAFEGAIVRSAGTRYASEKDFLSGEGAARFGGRWNRRGILAVYASLDVFTATHEAYQDFLDVGFDLSNIRPRIMAGATAKLSRVCNLTDPKIRRGMGFTLTELIEEDWHAIQIRGQESWTQAIARGCRTAGFEALLVPSARNSRGKNLVIFPDRMLPTSRLVALSAKDLPPHPDHWPP